MPTPRRTKSKVAVLKSSPETVLDDIAQLCELGGVRDALDARATTVLKDNISWHFPFPAANTTPWQLEGTIRALRAEGFSDLVCVQNKTVVTNAFKGEDLNGYVPIFHKYDIPVLYNFRPQDMTWIDYRPKTKMLVLDRVYPEGIRIPDYFPGKNVVHLPTVKCHIYTTTTGAMKNAFGGLLSTKRHYTHSWIHKTLVDLLAIQKEIHSGLFAIMDGTTAGNGPGPRTMIPVVKDYLLASADQVAIDAVAAKMMGFDPMKIEYIATAHEQGLGTGKPSEIEIVDETGTVRLKRAPRGASFVAFAHDDDGGRQRLVVVDSLTNVYLLDGAANMHRLGLVRRAAQPALVTGVSLVVRGAMAVVGVADALAAVNLAAGRIERRYDPAVVAEGPIDRVEILDARRVAGSPLPRFVVGIRRRAQPTTIVALLEGEGTAPRWRREAVEPRAWLTPQGVSVVTQLVGGTIRVSLEGRTQPALPWLPGAPFAIAESGNIAWLSAGAHLLRFEASGELGGVTLPGACTPDPPAADVLLRAVEAATAVTGRSERTGAALLAAVNQLMLRGSAGQRARAAWGFVRAWNAYRTTTFGRATFPPDVGYYWIVAGALEQASRDAASAGDSVLAARASEGRELADAFARLAMQGPSGGARGAVDDVAAFVRAHPRSPLVEFARLRALILAARAAGRDGLAEMREWLDRAVAANPATPAALQLVLYARAGWDVVPAPPAPVDPGSGAARLRRIVEAVERREPPARALGRERLSALGAWGLAIGLARRPDGWRGLREALAPARDRFDPDGLVFLWQPEPPSR